MMMDKAASTGKFVLYEHGNHEERLSHLQFADDILIMGPNSKENVMENKAILHLFELASGMKVHFHKCRLIGIKVHNMWLYEAANVLNCKVGAILFIYLGLPVVANLSRLETWNPIIKKVKGRLSKWRS
ncbi:ribonuclease H [Trifolium pratense]|uniref:Ribonuclease H n=1 Tax=Trifolium pratense TaxID=57577 RepID=A0A2K3L1T0_TRIPR|nr:ribonuclease H [Trifolium pratense]